MPPRSPQADNRLRTTYHRGTGYQIAIVPHYLKDGYLHFFDTILRKRNYRVLERRLRMDTLKRKLHEDIYNQLQKDQAEILRKYPHVDGLFDGYRYIIANTTNGRPIPRDFSEEDFLSHLEDKMKEAPQGPHGSNDYATAVNYNLGNGVITTLPVLMFRMVLTITPVRFNL